MEIVLNGNSSIGFLNFCFFGRDKKEERHGLAWFSIRLRLREFLARLVVARLCNELRVQ